MLSVELAAFGGVEHFGARHGPEEEPGPDAVRIAVRAIGFNPVDVKMRLGHLGGMPPMLLGRDVSGVVAAVGSSVSAFDVGDAVYARSTGAYAESVVVPAALVARKPETLSFAQAAALPVVGLTAYQSVVQKARVEPGEAVFVAGASGGVGSVAVPLLRHRGAGPILATAGSDASAAYVTERLGIDAAHVIRYRGKSRAQLAGEIRAITGGGGVQAAFDFVGGAMKRLCFDVVGVDGHVVTIVEEPAGFDLDVWDEHTSPLVLRSASLHFVQLAARLGHAPEATWPVYGRQLGILARLIDDGHLIPLPVTDVGPFSVEAVRRAHVLLEADRVRGKLVATCGDLNSLYPA